MVERSRYYQDRQKTKSSFQRHRSPVPVHDIQPPQFSFRGAYSANSERGGQRRSDSYQNVRHTSRSHHDARQHPNENFTFSCKGQHDLHFPSPTRQAHSDQRPRRQEFTGNERGEAVATARRDVNRRADHRLAQQRNKFRSRRANDREILHRTRRDETPEQLDGMKKVGASRFDLNSAQNEGDCIKTGLAVDTSNGSIGMETDEQRVKRPRLERSTETLTPRWSNPDPYTSLPPPETLGAPKRDIVKVIRQARLEPTVRESSQNAIAENVDFISLDIDMDKGEAAHNRVMQNSSFATNAGGASFYRVGSERGETVSIAKSGHDARVPRHDIDSISSHNAYTKPQESSALQKNGTFSTQQPERRSKKRKHVAEGSVGDLLEEWAQNIANNTPWRSLQTVLTLDPRTRLHLEICDFFDFVKPDVIEEAVRYRLIESIQNAVRTSNLPQARSVNVECFGSFAAGLYLPTADMDLVAVTPNFMRSGTAAFCQSRTLLHKLGASLRHMARPGELAVVARARVPIIKMTERHSGVKIDISVENRTGIDAVRTFERWKSRFPAMPILVVLIKQLLAMRGLNEVFSGGIGGFTVICLVTSMLQLMPECQAGHLIPTIGYGELLLRFLDLYGNKFDLQRTGIRMEPPGYFDKQRDPISKQNTNRLTIQDPNNATNDISGGSHLIGVVFEVFRTAHARLQRRLDSMSTGDTDYKSILGAILGGNYTSFENHRQQMRRTYERTNSAWATKRV